MNCKHVKDLLPLYAGHDLEDESARLIAAHLQICTACAGSALEYEQANQLLQQFEPPEFSDAAYAAVRHSVMGKIERESGALTLRELLLRPFQPRVMWAVSTAVLLVVCAFAYYFIANRTGVPQDQKATSNTEPAPAPTTGVPAALATGSPKVGLNENTPKEVAGGLPASPGSPKKPRLSQKLQTAVLAKRAGGTPAVPVNTVRYSLEEPNIQPLNIAVTSDKSLRLEMQTKDPNIRIIWFSHPSTNEGSPNESSKGI